MMAHERTLAAADRVRRIVLEPREEFAAWLRSLTARELEFQIAKAGPWLSPADWEEIRPALEVRGYELTLLERSWHVAHADRSGGFGGQRNVR